METRQALQQFITSELLNGRQALAPDDNLLTTGLVDSLGMLRLVAFIEERFATRVPPQDITIENFRSVNQIAAYLAAQRAA